MELSVRVQAESGPEVVGAARALVRTLLALWDCDDADDAGALLTSEIVSNAVRHAAGVLAVQLDLRLADEVVRVAVEDPATTQPTLRNAGAEEMGGRGLMLVDALAARWGSGPTERGKVVWFEFPIRRRRAPAASSPR
jgi:anti-sigma regulatory factor (Ser/Thr protein kinase)